MGNPNRVTVIGDDGNTNMYPSKSQDVPTAQPLVDADRSDIKIARKSYPHQKIVGKTQGQNHLNRGVTLPGGHHMFT